MTDETKKRITQLVEINRALAHDLDVSRRIVAELGNDRDYALRGAEAAVDRANRAEERLGALAARLRELEKERDIYMLKMDGMSRAMTEIRYRLSELPGGGFARYASARAGQGGGDWRGDPDSLSI